MDTYEKKYKKFLERARIWQDHLNESGDKDYADELNYIFPELVESEDEKVRKSLIDLVINYGDRYGNKQNMLDWLEKQGEQKPPIVDFKARDWYVSKVDGKIYNAKFMEEPLTNQKRRLEIEKAAMSATGIIEQEEWFIKGAEWSDKNPSYISPEKQGEQKSFDYENANIQQKDFAPKSAMEAIKEERIDNQNCVKPADNVETRFKVDDWVVFNNKHQSTYQVEKIEDGYYILRHTHGGTFRVCVLHDESLRLWNISDAKDGDVLVASDDSIFIFKDTIDGACRHYVALTTDDVVKFNEGLKHYWETSSAVHPATKEQREQLEKAMSDAGFTFDFEKKELKKIEQPAWGKEDERTIKRIDSLLYAINESDFEDIRAWLESLKGRVQPKQEWSEEDKKMLNQVIEDIVKLAGPYVCYHKDVDLLKNLKDKYTWKPSDEQMAALSDINCTGCMSYAGQGQELINLYNDLKETKGGIIMNGYTYTRVWQVDHKLVVAKTIEEAIALFKTYMGKDHTSQPKNVRAIGNDNYLVDYDAIIKEE